jgi:hypothetical protein
MTWRIRRGISLAAFLSVLACIVFSAKSAHAFPWMIREGYTGCNTCHADPSGAGILTQYGRGMEEVVLRMPYKKDADPGKIGNFAFGLDLPEQLLLQTDFRNLLLTLVPTTSGNSVQVQDIVMQLDQSAQLKVGRFRMMGSIGYTPPTETSGSFTFSGGANGATLTEPPGQDGDVVARQYWLGLDLGKDEQFLLRAGRIDVPYGIRTIEHPLLVRSVTRTDINTSQEHGVTLAYTGEKARGEVMAILGNYAIRPDQFRERGGSGFFEVMPSTNVAIGASALITHADLARTDLDVSLDAAPIWRQDYAIHARYSPVKSLVLLAEADALYNSQLLTTGSVNHFGLAGLLQADLQVTQGVHVIAAGEAYDGHIAEKGAKSTFDTTTAVGWLGAWWFFAPHLDARFDVVYASGSLQAGASPVSEGFSLLFQIHGYL